MEPFKLQLLIDHAGEILDKAACFNRNEEFARLQHNLELACEYCSEDELQKPLVIAIVGGTGVGKSYIFSSLCEVEGVSPSSASIRGFTRKLFISASEVDRYFLPFSKEDACFIEVSLPGIILIDTPDLDTIHADNARIAKETLSAADIIVCVTTPDKRSDFIVNESVSEWASRKRWFFAMNKADTADVPADQLRKDFMARLVKLGFEDSNDATFVFSATDKDSHAFKSFRESIISTRSLHGNHLLKQEACLRQLLHAFNYEHLTDRLLKLLMSLKNSREMIKSRLLQTEINIAGSEEIYRAAQQAFLSWAYLAASKRHSYFLFPYLMINRWLADGKDVTFLEKEVEQAYRNNIELKNHFTDERRSLEDKDLMLADDEHEPDLFNYFCDAGSDISHQIRQAAEQTANSKLFMFYILLANLPPLIVLLQVLYRSISSWFSAVWLPTDFFVHALFMMLAATIPGYLLVSKGLARISNQVVPGAPKRKITLKLLDSRIEQIENILQLSSQVYTSAENELQKVGASLPEKSYGISADGSDG